MTKKIKNASPRRSRTTNLIVISLFAVIIAISSWISIPGPVPFTLQTLSIFTAVGLLGGKLGTCAVLFYILLGALGLPVFSGFSGGFGILLSNKGGYILGFLFSALLMWAMEKLPGNRKAIFLLSMIWGLLLCYTFGTLWFMQVYLRTTGPVTLFTVLGWCVFPFILPDGLKIALAYSLTMRLKKHLRPLLQH